MIKGRFSDVQLLTFMKRFTTLSWQTVHVEENTIFILICYQVIDFDANMTV